MTSQKKSLTPGLGPEVFALFSPSAPVVHIYSVPLNISGAGRIEIEAANLNANLVELHCVGLDDARILSSAASVTEWFVAWFLRWPRLQG